MTISFNFSTVLTVLTVQHVAQAKAVQSNSHCKSQPWAHDVLAAPQIFNTMRHHKIDQLFMDTIMMRANLHQTSKV